MTSFFEIKLAQFINSTKNLPKFTTYAGTKYTSPVSSTFEASSSDSWGELIIPNELNHFMAEPATATDPLKNCKKNSYKYTYIYIPSLHQSKLCSPKHTTV